jgi:DNA repair protein RecN (Recombination protein N)
MLDELAVENLGVISRAHVEPGPGLVAVTGETGAGKTLLLGALRLLRGDAARSDQIGPDGEEARVEGRFLVDGNEVVAARRVAAGRSKAYLDGSMVPVRALAGRLDGVVEIVAQHEHVSLRRESVLRGIVDGGLDAEGRAARSAYDESWARLDGLRTDAEAIGGDRRQLEREADLARHQAREIEAAGVRAGEDTVLAATLQRLRHAEEIAAALAESHESLSGESGVGDRLGALVDLLRRAGSFDAEVGALAGDAAALAAQAGDLAAEVARRGDAVEHDPAALEEAEQRLAVLTDLKRKYGDTLEEVLEFGARAEVKAERVAGLLERADRLSAEIEEAEAAVSAIGEQLAETRRRSAKQIAQAAEAHLRDLGFARPVVDLRVAGAAASRHGADSIDLRFSSDVDIETGPVSRIASGGELSRLVLAVRLAGGVAEAPVVAFDEIDVGIGGSTALAMGEKLAALARGRQVLVVTHLPQVAAFADVQLAVDRPGNKASVRRVEGDDRLAELTRMLGGLPASERGRQHAAELLELARQRRAQL